MSSQVEERGVWGSRSQKSLLFGEDQEFRNQRVDGWFEEEDKVVKASVEQEYLRLLRMG